MLESCSARECRVTADRRLKSQNISEICWILHLVFGSSVSGAKTIWSRASALHVYNAKWYVHENCEKFLKNVNFEAKFYEPASVVDEDGRGRMAFLRVQHLPRRQGLLPRQELRHALRLGPSPHLCRVLCFLRMLHDYHWIRQKTRMFMSTFNTYWTCFLKSNCANEIQMRARVKMQNVRLSFRWKKFEVKTTRSSDWDRLYIFTRMWLFLVCKQYWRIISRWLSHTLSRREGVNWPSRTSWSVRSIDSTDLSFKNRTYPSAWRSIWNFHFPVPSCTVSKDTSISIPFRILTGRRNLNFTVMGIEFWRRAEL